MVRRTLYRAGPGLKLDDPGRQQGWGQGLRAISTGHRQGLQDISTGGSVRNRQWTGNNSIHRLLDCMTQLDGNLPPSDRDRDDTACTALASRPEPARRILSGRDCCCFWMPSMLIARIPDGNLPPLGNPASGPWTRPLPMTRPSARRQGHYQPSAFITFSVTFSVTLGGKKRFFSALRLRRLLRPRV